MSTTNKLRARSSIKGALSRYVAQQGRTEPARQRSKNMCLYNATRNSISTPGQAAFIALDSEVNKTRESPAIASSLLNLGASKITNALVDAVKRSIHESDNVELEGDCRRRGGRNLLVPPPDSSAAVVYAATQWVCARCGMSFDREDSFKRHENNCPGTYVAWPRQRGWACQPLTDVSRIPRGLSCYLS